MTLRGRNAPPYPASQFSAVAPQTRKQPRACACFVLLKTALIIFFYRAASRRRRRPHSARPSPSQLAVSRCVDRRVVVSSCHVVVSWYGGVALHARARCAVAARPAHLARRTYGDMALHARAMRRGGVPSPPGSWRRRRPIAAVPSSSERGDVAEPRRSEVDVETTELGVPSVTRQTF